PVTFTATVAVVAPGTGTPAGTVTFKDESITVGTGAVTGGRATFTTSILTVGDHTITASYGGATGFLASSGSMTGNPQAVGHASTSTAVTSSANPSVTGRSVMFTAIMRVTPTVT